MIRPSRRVAPGRWDRRAPEKAERLLSAETVTYMILAAAGLITLGAYGYLILVPAWTAYGRKWERVAAAVLTLFVLAAFAGAGLGTGLIVVYFWDDITGFFETTTRGAALVCRLELLSKCQIG